ncbi:hypothetical protein GCM10010399_63360 [Dactylosporangium fulvum]
MPHGRLGHRFAAQRGLDDGEHRVAAGRAVAADVAQQCPLADLGLPAAPGAAAAGAAVRVDDHVADLAAVAAVSGHEPPAGDDARADAGVAVEVEDVVEAGRGAPRVLGQGGDVGQVADERRAVVPERRAECVAERRAGRLAGGAGLRVDPDRAVGLADHTGDRHAAADEDPGGRGVPVHVVHERGERADRAGGLRPGWTLRRTAVEDRAAEPDTRGAQAVDLDAQRVAVDAGGPGADDE